MNYTIRLSCHPIILVSYKGREFLQGFFRRLFVVRTLTTKPSGRPLKSPPAFIEHFQPLVSSKILRISVSSVLLAMGLVTSACMPMGFEDSSEIKRLYPVHSTTGISGRMAKIFAAKRSPVNFGMVTSESTRSKALGSLLKRCKARRLSLSAVTRYPCRFGSREKRPGDPCPGIQELL